MEELDEEPRPVGANGGSHTLVAADDLREVPAERVRGQQARRVNRSRLEHDQARPTPRPRLVVGDEVVGRQVVVDERRLVRRRDDPVLDLDRPQRERAEQVLEH